MRIEQVTYLGWEKCIQLTHQELNLIITTAVGPRVIHCGFTDSDNLFYVHPQQSGTIGGNEWKTYGGHRLWCAPEDLATTYAPDNSPVEVEEFSTGVRFIAPLKPRGIQKTISISPVEGQNKVQIEHVISNKGSNTLRLAPWALTVMRQGGTAIIPHNLDRPRQLLPSHSLSLWGYTQMSDPRWHWGNRYIHLRQDPAASTAQKFGCQNPYGWAGYAVNDQFFLKRFAWNETAIYPDFNCNFEAYTDQAILELETLAPLCELQPGESATHREEWSLYRNIPLPVTEADVDRLILPLLG